MLGIQIRASPIKWCTILKLKLKSPKPCPSQDTALALLRTRGKAIIAAAKRISKYTTIYCPFTPKTSRKFLNKHHDSAKTTNRKLPVTSIRWFSRSKQCAAVGFDLQKSQQEKNYNHPRIRVGRVLIPNTQALEFPRHVMPSKPDQDIIILLFHRSRLTHSGLRNIRIWLIWMNASSDRRMQNMKTTRLSSCSGNLIQLKSNYKCIHFNPGAYGDARGRCSILMAVHLWMLPPRLSAFSISQMFTECSRSGPTRRRASNGRGSWDDLLK